MHGCATCWRDLACLQAAGQVQAFRHALEWTLAVAAVSAAAAAAAAADVHCHWHHARAAPDHLASHEGLSWVAELLQSACCRMPHPLPLLSCLSGCVGLVQLLY